MKVSGLKTVLGSLVILGVAGYFASAAIQGNFGVVKRVQITAEKAELTAERDRLAAEVARMQNLAERLSDSYLDLDLLDERVRNVLGYARADELVIR
jgi:cell division protein FtsB